MLNVLISVPAVLFNLMLIGLIYGYRSSMRAMFPVLIFGAIVDCIFGLFNLIISPYLYLGFGYMIGIDNGFIETNNTIIVGILCSITGSLVWFSWIVIPIQFIYRLSIMVKGKPPSQSRLVVYVGITLLGCCIAVPNCIQMYFKQHDGFLRAAKNILQNGGYLNLNLVKIRGACWSEFRFWVFIVCAGAVCETCYGIIVYCELSIRRHLKGLQLLTDDRSVDSINRDVGRALIALSLPPFFNSVLTSLYIIFSTLHCVDMGIANLLCSVLYVSGPFINSLSTIILVKPYRSAILRLFGISNDTKVTTVGGAESSHFFKPTQRRRSTMTRTAQIPSSRSFEFKAI
ncbi:hypothetical protein M3Y98_01046500 [Aphelenchoides besseyi]|nr:hypothetical protein M3Y98_01046500 [Aphelenchoides besseyi]